MSRLFLVVAALAWLSSLAGGGGAIVRAAESLGGSSAAEGPADAADIERWLKQLAAPGFSARQAASRKLAEAGAQALPALEKAAAGGEREVADRALEIIKQHFRSPDEAEREQAREALKRLEASPKLAVAQRARDVLNPPRPASIAMNNWPPGRVPVVTRTVTTHEVNGRRQMEIRENDRKVTIRTSPAGRIEVEVNETANGRATSRKIEAADLAELKRKDESTAQLYEQYSALQRRPAANMFGFPMAGGRPVVMPVVPAPGRAR